MSNSFLETPIEFLKGVGPLRAQLLNKELGIFTFDDLIHHFPFRYVDRTKFYSIRETSAEMPYIQLKGQLKSLVVHGGKSRKHLTGRFEDETGFIELKWFQGLKWVANNLKLNNDYILFGKPTVYNGYMNIVHPELELASESAAVITTIMQPVYSTTDLKSKPLNFSSRSIFE